MKIVMLVGKSQSAKYFYNSLCKKYDISKVIIEDKVPAKQLIKRRIKKLGFLKVLNQILFQLIIPKILFFNSKKRIQSIKKKYNLIDSDIPVSLIHKVKSVNDESCVKLLKKIAPNLVIVNGTRIISSKVLDTVDSYFINTHVGITPQYRGVHGAYWALANNDKENCGVTVHLVDKGIDTGNILSQGLIEPTKKDNFVTYPLHQYGEGIKLLENVILQLENGKIEVQKKSNASSKLYYHPTFSLYLKNLFLKE